MSIWWPISSRRSIHRARRLVFARAIRPAPNSVPCTLFDLTAESCRWPLGDPGHEDFRFCGAPKTHCVYCAHHHALGYDRTPVVRGVAPPTRLVRGVAG